MRVLFILFALLPILEIALLINVGSVIGGWNTVGLVLLSAFIGAYFVKREGVSTLQTAQEKMQRNEVPGKELVEGLMLVVAGILISYSAHQPYVNHLPYLAHLYPELSKLDFLSFQPSALQIVSNYAIRV